MRINAKYLTSVCLFVPSFFFFHFSFLKYKVVQSVAFTLHLRYALVAYILQSISDPQAHLQPTFNPPPFNLHYPRHSLEKTDGELWLLKSLRHPLTFGSDTTSLEEARDFSSLAGRRRAARRTTTGSLSAQVVQTVTVALRACAGLLCITGSLSAATLQATIGNLRLLVADLVITVATGSSSSKTARQRGVEWKRQLAAISES